MIEKKLRKYIVPNMFAMLGISVYVLADTLFISLAAGANGITALNLALPVFGIIFAIGALIGVGSATKYNLSRADNQGDSDEYFSNAIFWSLCCSMVFVVIGLFNPSMVLRLMGADDVILNVGLPYIRTILLFAPAFMLNYTFTSFVRNDGAPNIAMAATITSSLLNVVFDYIFMFPMGLGMLGAALATGISPIVSMLICMTHFKSDKSTVKLKKITPSLVKLKESCALGVVGFVGEISSGITTMVFNFILLNIVGNIAVAAYGVIANVSLVAIAIFNGIAQGLQPMASEAEVENDEDAKARIKKYSLKVGVVCSLIFVGILWKYSAQIVSVFNSENSVEMANYADIGLRLYSIGFLLAVVNIINAGYFSAIGMAKMSSVISFSRGVIAIVVFAFVLSSQIGIYGVWLAFPASELFTFILYIVLKYKKMYIDKKSSSNDSYNMAGENEMHI